MVRAALRVQAFRMKTMLRCGNERLRRYKIFGNNIYSNIPYRNNSDSLTSLLFPKEFK